MWKSLRILGLLLFLSLLPLLPARVAQAANGDVHLVVYSVTTSQVICISDTGSDACSMLHLIKGYRYRFTLTEKTNQLFEDGKINLTGFSSFYDPVWEFNSGSFTGSGGVGCGSGSWDPVYYECWGNTNWMSSLVLEATANTQSYGTVTATLKRVGLSQKTATSNYQLEFARMRVQRCSDGFFFPDNNSSVTLARNTCYRFIGTYGKYIEAWNGIQKLAPDQIKVDPYFSIQPQPWPHFLNLSYSQGTVGSVTCDLPLGGEYRRCIGANPGGGQISWIQIQFTTCNCAGASSVRVDADWMAIFPSSHVSFQRNWTIP